MVKTVCIVTLGCKVNQYESGQIAAKYRGEGYRVVYGFTDEAADVYVVNTCAVTAAAVKKSRNAAARARREGGGAPVVVCGCAGERRLNDEVENFRAVQQRGRAFIKVQDGCDNFCSYCIVPHRRGRSKSRPIDSIVAEVSAAGKPVVLTGIDLSDYGRDEFGRGGGLARLCRAVDECGLPFELSSVEIGIITPAFLRVLFGCANFVPRFHLPLQSASDRVLRDMNRKYTGAEFARAIDLIREFFPDAVLSVDVIVGFPTETEEDFLQTLDFLKQHNFAHAHVFRYSKREGTAAAHLGELPAQVTADRAKRIGAVIP